MKIMLLGYGRSGKGTFCEEAEKMGLTAISSSKMASTLGVFNSLEVQHGYPDSESFYENRHIDRKGCYEAICDFVKGDLGKLGREIFASYDIYDGCRDALELVAIAEESLYDISIWIDAGDRIAPESKESMTITADMADIILENKGDEVEYRKQVRLFLKDLMQKAASGEIHSMCSVAKVA